MSSSSPYPPDTPRLTIMGWAAEQEEWKEIAVELLSLFATVSSSQVSSVQRERMLLREQRPMTQDEVLEEVYRAEKERAPG